MRESPTLVINEQVQERKARGEAVWNLGFGASPFGPTQAMLDAAAAGLDDTRYVSAEGIPALQDALRTHIRGRGHKHERTLVAPGSKEILWMVMQALRRPVLLPSPSWVSYAPQAEFLGLGWHAIACDDDWHPLPESLAKHRGGLLILNSPNNPTGAVIPPRRLQELAKVAAQNDIIVLSDEIYSGLAYGDHHSIASYHDQTIITDGLSKWAGCGGWRLGVAWFPESLAVVHTAVKALASETYSCASVPIQHGAVPAFDMGPEVRRRAEINRQVGQACHAALRDVVDVRPPQGAFYLFPIIPGGGPSEALAQRLIDQGIATLPGTAFLRPPEEPSLRLALSDYDPIVAADQGPEATQAVQACHALEDWAS